mmetsp:Transcript_30826/g.45994  ORF Transcript_30826/g.45994 Transcript_30826/m.45994 type:complete len:117 (-) Transcript_30826:291-641(-)
MTATALAFRRTDMLCVDATHCNGWNRGDGRMRAAKPALLRQLWKRSLGSGARILEARESESRPAPSPVPALVKLADWPWTHLTGLGWTAIRRHPAPSSPQGIGRALRWAKRTRRGT